MRLSQYELGFLAKCAEHDADPVAIAAFLEKSGSMASRFVGGAINALGRTARTAASGIGRNGVKNLSPNFAERLGSQLQQQGFRGTAMSGLRRAWGRGATTSLSSAQPSGIRGYWDNLTGRTERRFMQNIDGPTFREMASEGSKTLKNGTGTLRQMGADRANMMGLEKSQNLLPSGFVVGSQNHANSVYRQAARIQQAQRSARIGTGFAGLGLVGAGGMYGASRINQGQPYQQNQYGYNQYGSRFYG